MSSVMPPRIGRRALLRVGALAAVLPWMGSSRRLRAEGRAPFPISGKPIRLVVPAAPGGPADLMARALAKKLHEQNEGALVVVENKPGGASVPAAAEIARAAPDGHHLLLTLNLTHTQVPHLIATLPYDPLRDFTPVTSVYQGESILVARPSFPANDLRQAIELSRQTGPLPGGSASPGTNTHLLLEILNMEYGARFTPIPYKGSADAMRDLLGGFTAVQFDSPVTALPHIRAGRLKALAVTGDERLPQLPDVATVGEQGFPSVNRSAWMGIFAPAGMNPDVLAALNAELVKALRSPEMLAQFEPLGVTVTGTSPEEFAETVRRDYDAWGQVIKPLGLRLDQ